MGIRHAQTALYELLNHRSGVYSSTWHGQFIERLNFKIPNTEPCVEVAGGCLSIRNGEMQVFSLVLLAAPAKML